MTEAPARAAIHDLGYKRYLGTRRPQSTRWRVIVRNHIAMSWRGFWRLKVALIGATITTIVFGVLMVLWRSDMAEQVLGPSGVAIKLADAMLPVSWFVWPWLALVLTATIGATAVPRDLAAGAFEFYFARPVRPLDYVLGKVGGMVVLMATILLAGPLLLALLRVGLSPPGEMAGVFVSVVPRTILIGGAATLAYAVLPMAFGALAGKARYAIGAWMGFYFLIGPIVDGVGRAIDRPDLGAFNGSRAAIGLAEGLYGANLPKFGQTPSWPASLAALLGYAAIGFAIVWWRVKRAERAGLGGG